MFFGELASAPARFLTCTLTSEKYNLLSAWRRLQPIALRAFAVLCFASRLLPFVDSRPVLAIAALYATKRSAIWPVLLFTLAHCCACGLQSCTGRGHGIIVAMLHCCATQQCKFALNARCRDAARHPTSAA